jgi:hypothetical protein
MPALGENGQTSDNAKQYGQPYNFGLSSYEQSQIDNMVLTSIDYKYESEIFVQAQNGEGITDSVVASQAGSRKITGTFTGYVT